MPTTLTETQIRHGVRTNAKTWANRFEARLLEPGVVDYSDMGCGLELVSYETLARCATSFVGRPVIIKHKRVNPETMQQHAVGYISDVRFNPDDGWWWCSGTIHDEEAKDLIRKGWSVSSSYRVTDVIEGPTYHNAKLHQEITDFEGEHLAIVDNPRYEKAVIRLNSKRTTNMFKWFKKLLQSGETKDNSAAATPEAEEVSGESAIEINGKSVSLAELAERYNAAPVAPAPVTEVDVDGTKVAISDLIAGYRANQAAPAKEEKDEEKRENESDEKKDEEKRENESDEKKDEEKKEEKRENAAPKPDYYEQLLGARDNAMLDQNVAPSVDTIEQRMERARVRYSLKQP